MERFAIEMQLMSDYSEPIAGSQEVPERRDQQMHTRALLSWVIGNRTITGGSMITIEQIG